MFHFPAARSNGLHETSTNCGDVILEIEGMALDAQVELNENASTKLGVMWH